jgi:hypothetical protein
MVRLLLCASLLAAVTACGDDASPGDAAPLDAALPDAALSDAVIDVAEGSPDAVVADAPVADAPPVDAAAVDGAAALDAGVALPGFGDISGSCGVLGPDDWTATTPRLVRATITFATGYTDADLESLSESGQHVIEDGNAGGSSLESEGFAADFLYRCELATVLKTEMEIAYSDTDGKRTDFLESVDGVQIGVSVTRAFAWPPDAAYTVAQATTLLTDKLGDVLLSSDNVIAPDVWLKEILLVEAYTAAHADSIETAWAALDPSLTADTIVYVLVTEGDDAFIY